MRRLWPILCSVLALLATRSDVKAASVEPKPQPNPELNRETVIAYGDYADAPERKAFEHKQKIRAWYRAHGMWANEPDMRPRTWVPKNRLPATLNCFATYSAIKQRWVILSSDNPSLAWSGSGWVKHKLRISETDFYTSDTKDAAEDYARTCGLNVLTVEDTAERLW